MAAAVFVLLSIMRWPGQQFLDLLCPFGGILVIDELANLVRRWQLACHVQRHTPQEGGIVAKIGRVNVQMLELVQHMLVDEIVGDSPGKRVRGLAGTSTLATRGSAR